MSVPPKKIKGIRDIPTLSGKCSQIFSPYKAYMKLAHLEMEKLRREKERESALLRIENLQENFQKIETEKRVLIEKLAEREEDIPVVSIFGKSPQKGKKGAFKLKY